MSSTRSTGSRVRAAVLAFFKLILCFPMMILIELIAKTLVLFPNNWILKRHPDLKEAVKLNLSHKAALDFLQSEYLHFLCPLKVGLQAPNIDVITLDGSNKKLLDFQRAGRPLVVNFGSCT